MKRKLIWVVVVLGVLLGAVALSAPLPAASGKCHKKCYAAKSEAYQLCRKIPPAHRADRTRCFRVADTKLESCLKRCK